MNYLRILTVGVSVAALLLSGTIANTNGSYRVIRSKPTPMEIFIRDVATRESTNRQFIKNEFGMLGLYQFSPTTLRQLGYRGNEITFLKNKELQDTMMVRNIVANYRTLEYYINKYNNKTYKGVRVTVAGVLAAAHLGGPGSVMDWFKNNDQNGRTDAYGTSIRSYMIRFGHHKLEVL